MMALKGLKGEYVNLGATLSAELLGLEMRADTKRKEAGMIFSEL